jgi:hypothetical protein
MTVVTVSIRRRSTKIETGCSNSVTLDKFIGDAIIGPWGTSAVDESHSGHLLSRVPGAIGAPVRFNRPIARFNRPIAATRSTLDKKFGVCTEPAASTQPAV